MAFKIKDNLDLYGNQLLNFALQSDSGFPQSPQVGHIFNYTGTGVMANHAVMCVDETTKAFKALAFVDEIATNTAFKELEEKVDLLIGDDVDTDTIIDSWKEVQAFLADIEDTKTLQGMLSSYLPLSGGTIEGTQSIPLVIKTTSYTAGIQIANAAGNRVFLGWNEANGLHLYNYTSGAFLGIKDDGTPTYNNNTLIHSGNYSDYALPLSGGTIAVSSYTGFSVRNTSDSLALIRYRGTINGTNTILGYLGLSGVDTPVFMTASGNINTLLHSGNIGSYGVKIDRSKEQSTASADAGNFVGYGNNSFDNWKTVGPILSFGDAGYYAQFQKKYNSEQLYFRSIINSTKSDWKTIAFTDSDITGNAGSATKLQTKRTIWGQEFDGTADLLYFHRPKVDYYYFSVDGSNYVGYIGKAGGANRLYFDALTGYDVAINANGGSNGILLTINNNVLIGTQDEIKSGAKLQIKGDLYVDGNIIATKEVSAGGAGQEGESGDGGAEVIDKELAKGQSSYTIPNTIGRSAVAVSLYEWNANNGSWDMCLADISVKDATITVTFGSATSVNHKLVAVG